MSEAADDTRYDIEPGHDVLSDEEYERLAAMIEAAG